MKYVKSIGHYLFAKLLLVLLAFSVCQCHKTRQTLTISLYNQPLSQIKMYTKGKWRLQYSNGGFAYQVIPGKNNQYLQILDDRLLAGNDLAAATVDAPLSWYRVYWPGSLNDSTYLLSAGNGNYPYYFIDGIVNDTLIMHDFASDAFYYHYTKF